MTAAHNRFNCRLLDKSGLSLIISDFICNIKGIFDVVIFFLATEEPAVTPPYEETWYNVYDDYGMSMELCSGL